jgi:hypothetical protein
MGTRIHSGNWLDCKVCPHTPEELKAKREKRERPTFKRKRVTAATVDLAVRRQVAYELGGIDAEPTSEQKFQMLQKYGIAAPRIDRAISKPKWMTEGRWRTLKAEFYQATKNLIPKEQFKRNQPAMSKQERESQQRRQHRNYPQRNSSGSRPSYAQGQTGDRQR